MIRIFDFVVSFVALIALSPLLLALAILVRTTSPGPALFRQDRVGLSGQTFNILKFRSMRQPSSGEAGALVTSEGDPRITKAGQLLRSTKLDELPQLINVLCGDMSLVGPRPEVPRYVAEWTSEQRETILSVRPGITDPASVQFRREAALLAAQEDPETYYINEVLPHKAEIYVDYVLNRTLTGDIKILFKTLRSVLTG